MSRLENSLKNVTSGLLFQMLQIVLKFVNRTVFIRFLGVSYLGIAGLFGDVLTMLSLADLGLETAMTYSMYEPLAKHDYKTLAGLVGYYKRIYRIIAGAVAIIGLSLIPFLKYLINLDTDIPYINIYYVLFLANTVASYLVVYKTSIVNADQKNYILVRNNGVFGIIKTLAMTAVLCITRNYIAYLVVSVAFTYANNLYNSYIARKLYPFIEEKILLCRDKTDKILGNMRAVFLYKLSGVLINATDNTLISVLVGTVWVGYYSNYSMIINQVTAIVNTCFYSLTASLGNLIVTEGKEKRLRIFMIMQSLSNVFSIVCVSALLLLSGDLIRIWLGEEYVLESKVLWAIAINFYLSVSLLPIWVFREATGLYLKTRYVMLSTAVINIVLSIILGKITGLFGILIATTISRLLTYFWYEPKLLFKEYFGKSCIVYFAGVLKNIIVAIGNVTICYIMSNCVDVTDVTTLILKSGIVMLLSIAGTGLIYKNIFIDRLKLH